jgi:hypothetical protein
MSYSKVVLILANLVSNDTAATPPNPAPKAHEVSKYAGSDFFNPLVIKLVPFSYRVRTINLSNIV